MKKILEFGAHGQCRPGLVRLVLLLFVVNPGQDASAQCDLQIASASPCLADSTPGTPKVGDDYGLRVTVNVVGTPTQPFRIRWTLANVTNYFDNISLGPGSGYWWYILSSLALDDPIPWTVTLDPDGVTGDTNAANNTASGTFTPVPPVAPAEFYAPRLMHGSENYLVSFQPGSGTIGNLYVLMGEPTSHGAQSILTVSGPPNAQAIVTSPFGAPLFQVAWTNVPAATFQGTDTFAVQLSRARVNPMCCGRIPGLIWRG
jgi:hypothetical protein